MKKISAKYIIDNLDSDYERRLLQAEMKLEACKKAKRLLEDDSVVFVDTATSGLSKTDEVIGVAILNANKECLFNSLICPTVDVNFHATRKHGFIRDELQRKPTYDKLHSSIVSLLTNKTIIGYNVDFDLRMLKQSAAAYNMHFPSSVYLPVCAMQLFAEFYGEYKGFYKKPQAKKMDFAVQHLNIYQRMRHVPSADCETTLDLNVDKKAQEYLSKKYQAERLYKNILKYFNIKDV